MKRLLQVCLLMAAMCITLASLVACDANRNTGSTRTVVDVVGAEVVIPTEVDEIINFTHSAAR